MYVTGFSMLEVLHVNVILLSSKIEESIEAE